MDISTLHWQVMPNRVKVVDEWGYPKFFTTEKVIAFSETGKQIEIMELGGGEMDSGLRRYIVDTHNGRLREEALKAIEAAKPILYERIKDYHDLFSIVQSRREREDMLEELERKGHKIEAYRQLSTRLPPDVADAFKTMASKLNVEVAILIRALLLHAAQDLLEKERKLQGDSGGMADIASGAKPEAQSEVRNQRR